MTVPILPDSAPFTPAQRAWLNGFFAGVFNLGDGASVASIPNAAQPTPIGPVPAPEEDFPWHDPNLPLGERLKRAEGQPPERVLMAAMAQLDCGACGYLCRTYSEAIARGEETDLAKCTPGGRETSKQLKTLVAAQKAATGGLAPTATPATAGANAASASAARPGATDDAVSNDRYDRRNPFRAPLLACERLNRSGSEKDVRKVVLSLRGSGLSYEVGDALGVVPENDPALVESVLTALGARGDEVIALPNGGAAHSYEVLATTKLITRVSDELASLLLEHATDAAERSTLQALVEDDPEGVPANWDVLDILEQFPTIRPPVEAVVAALSPLQPRLYSISSSLKAVPGEVHLTVGMVRYAQGGRPRRGVASCFLGETMRAHQKAGVFVHTSPGFRLPRSHEAPIIMIGPGTGIAPFRAFLQDRAADGAKGRNWLLFGDQRRATDFLYQEELEGYCAGGLLTRLDLAFSRDQTEKVYVQHRMLEAAEELWAWLDEGAHVYVCGDARRMALDVDAALHEIVARQGGLSVEAAREFVKDLNKAGRYQRDIY